MSYNHFLVFYSLDSSGRRQYIRELTYPPTINANLELKFCSKCKADLQNNEVTLGRSNLNSIHMFSLSCLNIKVRLVNNVLFIVQDLNFCDTELIPESL